MFTRSNRRRTAAAVVLTLVAICVAPLGCGEDQSIGGPTASGDVTAQGDSGRAGLDGAAAADAADGAVEVDVMADAGVDTGALDTIDAAGVDGAVEDATAPGCSADQCDIGGICWENGAANPANPCEVCFVLGGADTWSADDTASCDDALACTTDDRCDSGACIGTAIPCEDGNLCSDDDCDADSGDCVHLANALTCTDGDVCSVGDACADQVCAAGSALPCDDGNPCTDDACDPTLGCQVNNNAATCDDGDACTSGDTCAAGSCSVSEPVDCDDADVCTVDACLPASGCKHTSIADQCVDENTCTDDACDPVDGCVYAFNTDACDDASLCTHSDTCGDGVCLGAKVTVDDANPCTDDSCAPATGPIHAANALPCDDANACTLGDTCGGSACLAGAATPDCDDANPCTDDACEPAKGCVHVDNVAPCDDGSACTEKDTCAAAACVGAKVDCSDGNACTTDTCDPDSGCKSTLIISHACRPQIVIEYPPRAATIQQPDAAVTVSGTVKSGAGAITAFQINGEDVAVAADGSFAKVVASVIGGNTLVVDAVDSMGSKRHRVQAWLWSPAYLKPDVTKPKSGMVDAGMGYWLSKQVIDDGDHTPPPNDLATVFELVMQSFDIGGLIPDPAYQGSGVTMTISNLTHGKATTGLTPVAGGLKMVATIPNVAADVVAKYKPFKWFPAITLNGKLIITAIVITADVSFQVVNH